MQKQTTDTYHIFPSIGFAGQREIRFAQFAILVSVVVFLIAVPFAKQPLGQIPAFIPVYVSAFVICDLLTAALLFGQYNFLRSRALLVLAGGYLFSASITFAYALIFPGLLSPTGLFGAGPQTTSAMYMFWHAGFPLAVIAYALLKDKETEAAVPSIQPRRNAGAAVLLMMGSVIAIVVGYTLFATQGNAYIPLFLENNKTSDLGHVVLSGVWVLSFAALLVLWLRRPHTAIDVWLMVVMCVWLCDIALAAILNTGRYDLGWYIGRIYGLLAASFLLIVLLVENGANYARLAQLSSKLSTANTALELLSMQDGLTTIANRRLFDKYLAEQIAVACRHQRTLALVLCDVDCFKAYNDHYGHQAGDDCLKAVAAALQMCCRRPADMVARYGGEEFALILPDTDASGATVIAEAARNAVARMKIPHVHSPVSPYISISGGLVVRVCTPGLTAQELIIAADQVLYEAKHLGRNQMVFKEDKHTEPVSSVAALPLPGELGS